MIAKEGGGVNSWSHLVVAGKSLSQLWPTGQIWNQLVTHDNSWSHLVTTDNIWSHLATAGHTWQQMVTPDSSGSHLAQSGHIWHQLVNLILFLILIVWWLGDGEEGEGREGKRWFIDLLAKNKNKFILLSQVVTRFHRVWSVVSKYVSWYMSNCDLINDTKCVQNYVHIVSKLWTHFGNIFAISPY